MEADTLATMITILVAVLGSSAITIGTVLKQMNHLDTKFTEKFDRLTEKSDGLDTRFTVLETKVTALSESSKERGRVLGEVRERLSRMEGYLMAPEGLALQRILQPDTDDGSADDPGTEHRQGREAG